MGNVNTCKLAIAKIVIAGVRCLGSMSSILWNKARYDPWFYWKFKNQQNKTKIKSREEEKKNALKVNKSLDEVTQFHHKIL